MFVLTLMDAESIYTHAVLGIRHGHSAHQSQDCLLIHHRCQMTLHASILATNVPVWASRASQARDSCSAGNRLQILAATVQLLFVTA